MEIKKKFFLITAVSMLMILFVSHSIMYSYFYHAMVEETMRNQRTNVELNKRMADNFLESIYDTAVQIVSDETFGEYLSLDSKDPMDILRTRQAIQTRFSRYAAHQIIDSSYYKTTLFLSDLIPIAQSLEGYTLESSPYIASNFVLSNSEIKDDEWYQQTIKNGIFVFLNKSTNEICIARKITNNYYIGPHNENGTGVIVVSVADKQLEKILSSVPVTKNSGYAMLNDDGKILYCSNSPIEYDIYDKAWVASEKGKIKEFTLQERQDDYRVNYCKADYGIQFLFLTPDYDIQDAIHPILSTYSLIFAAVSLFFLLVICSIVSRLSRPIIQFSTAVENIRDIKDFDRKKLHVSDDKELLILENSFSKLIDNILIQNEREKGSQLRALQAQINPHFIYNALDMVNWMALTRHCDDIANIVSSIVEMMRYSITNADSMVPISKEIENIQEFLSVYKLRYNKNFLLETQLGEKDILIPKFTLQPLVENSVRHAQPFPGESLCIRIYAYYTKESAIIEVHDNGLGCEADKLNRHINYEETDLRVSNGFGIRNVNERIGLRFRGKSSLNYRNETDGTLTAVIMLELPDSNSIL